MQQPPMMVSAGTPDWHQLHAQDWHKTSLDGMQQPPMMVSAENPDWQKLHAQDWHKTHLDEMNQQPMLLGGEWGHNLERDTPPVMMLGSEWGHHLQMQQNPMLGSSLSDVISAGVNKISENAQALVSI